MMTDFDPPKVTARELPAATLAPSPASAMLAAPINSGRWPNSFDKRSRILLPPTLRCTI
jgi:hypothetical protein